MESRVCNDFPCDGGCAVGEWSEWSECSKLCGGGTRSRTRVVEASDSADTTSCPPSEQSVPCNLHDCGESPLSPTGSPLSETRSASLQQRCLRCSVFVLQSAVASRRLPSGGVV